MRMDISFKPIMVRAEYHAVIGLSVSVRQSDIPTNGLPLPGTPSITRRLSGVARVWRLSNMAVEKTLSIIKPDATRRNLTGQINARFEEAGLRIVAQKRMHLTRGQAEQFYYVHNERAFFGDLCDFMSSGPIVVQVLEGEDAIAKNREIMGATNPANADDGTIRKDLGESVEANSVHGSDAPETAAWEISYFFAGLEIVG